VFDGLFYKTDRSDDREQLLLDQLNAQSPDKKEPLTRETINDFITNHKTDDIFNLCNGHDVTALLVKTFNINSKQLATALRLSFHHKQFAMTVLYQKLSAWQIQHSIAILYSFSDDNSGG
jgi:ribosomal protein L16 Arg81 hydroxylase